MADMQTTALSPGAQIGNYLVVSQLGEGGTSTVYRATHAHVRREVALKVLGPDYPKSRFLAEARAIGSIAPHPNIVEIFDCGKTEDGQLYYVMELLQGRVLSQMIGSRLSPAETLPYLEQICAGLEAAHRMGVVHRDVKAANIFVLDGEPLRLKLFDFGVARLPELLTADMGMTSQGVVIGTPASMSPEQAAGKTEKVCPQTDLYAVGVLLYQMIAGRGPFEAQDVATLLACHINDEPPPLAELASVSTALSDIVLRCLNKDPADRPESAEALYQAFADVVNDELEETDRTAEHEGRPRDDTQRRERPTIARQPTTPPQKPADISASWSDGIELPADAVDRSGPFEMQRLSTGALQQISRPSARDDSSSHRIAWVGGIALLLIAGAAWLLVRDSGSVTPSVEPDASGSLPAKVDSAAATPPDSQATTHSPAVVDAASKPAAPDLARPPKRAKRPPKRKPHRRKPRPKIVRPPPPPPPAPDTGPPPTVVPPAGKVIGVEPTD